MNVPYQILRLISAVHGEWMGNHQKSLNEMLSKFELSEAQEAFLESVGIAPKWLLRPN